MQTSIVMNDTIEHRLTVMKMMDLMGIDEFDKYCASLVDALIIWPKPTEARGDLNLWSINQIHPDTTKYS